MKKILIAISSVFIIIGASAVIYVYPSYQWMVAVKPVTFDSQLTVYIGGGNTVVLRSKDGSHALIVDTKKKRAGKTLRKMIHAKDITIINTHYHQDHTRMNRLYPGATIIAGAYPKELWKKETGNGHYPDIAMNAHTDTTLFFDDEKVHIYNIGQAHTTNDIVVYFENHKILAIGDLIFHKMHPAMLHGDASCTRLISTLDSLYNAFDSITVIPGHGIITDKSAILQMKDYYQSIYNAIGDDKKIATLRKKYRHYFTFMNATDFDRNVEFIKKEKIQQPTVN